MNPTLKCFEFSRQQYLSDKKSYQTQRLQTESILFLIFFLKISFVMIWDLNWQESDEGAKIQNTVIPRSVC